MSAKSPLTQSHLDRGGSILPYPDPADPTRFAEVVEAFGPIEIEYAALRKGCVLLDQPQRGTIAVTGADRIEFLNRMLTQELKGLGPWQSRRAFWLNRKGRVDADLRLTAIDESWSSIQTGEPLAAPLLIDLDIHSTAGAIETLGSYVFSEDLGMVNATESLHRLGLHGPAAARVLGEASEPEAGPDAKELVEGQACIVRIGGAAVLVERWDWLGEIGLELTCATDRASRVYEALLGSGAAEGGATPSVRPAGWHACNLARIEAGVPLYYLDFGPESLPHETGVLRDRVSFKKGCYLGQEVVARIESLGQPKQMLVGLRLEDDSDPESSHAEGGAAVYAESDSEKPVGEVTSAAVAPMLGGVPVCFAVVRTAHAMEGTKLAVEAGGGLVTAVVQADLRFWSRG